MKIGIAGPISVKILKNYLDNLTNDQLEIGSGCSAVNYLIIGLLNNGHHISVYTLDDKVTNKDPIKLNGERLNVYVGEKRYFNRFNKIKLLDIYSKEINQIKNFILEDNPDLVHAHWSYEFAIGTIKSGLPHLITFRDNANRVLKLLPRIERVIRYFMDFWVKRNSINFTANSPYIQQNLPTHLQKIVPVIPNTYDPFVPFGTPKKLPEKKIRIISILSGWGKIKNPKPAIKAFKILRDKNPDYNFEYHIYGGGFERNSAGYKWCEKNKLAENIYFHGFVHHNELMDQMENYDILLHPSIEESFGNTIVEGLMKGVPVVAGENVGAIPWLLNYGRNGILVDVQNPEKIASGIVNLLNNSELYEQLSSLGINYIKEKFSFDKIVDRHIEEYNNILGKMRINN